MAVEVDARWEPMGALEYYDYWRAMYSARNMQTILKLNPLHKQEEEIVIVKLPIVGDENEGEFIISFLFILISLNFIFMFLFVEVNIFKGYFKSDSYLDPSFMSIIKDPDLWCKEMGKFAQAQKGFSYASAPTRTSDPPLESSNFAFPPTHSRTPPGLTSPWSATSRSVHAPCYLVSTFLCALILPDQPNWAGVPRIAENACEYPRYPLSPWTEPVRSPFVKL
ncbi:hypothetical protein ACJX0J_030800, partial [Zea mays]